MPDELVTIAHEFSPLTANLMRTRLEADGISCFLKGETLTGLVGSFSQASASWNHPEGNIALQVLESEAIRAREILCEIESMPRDEEDEDWIRGTPNYALNLVRGVVICALALQIIWWVYNASQNWWLGGLAGSVTLCLLYFLSFKNSFRTKR